jgi:carboxyl-terminal processing protease
VITPFLDSPAIKAGVRPGDVIEEVDGQSIRGLDLAGVINKLRGKEGAAVRLKVTHADGRVEDLTITRRAVVLLSIRGFRIASDHWDFLLDPDHAIGYAHVGLFGDDTVRELKAAIEGLKGRGMKGLILDLRGCSGGKLSAAVAVGQLFLSKGTIVTMQGRGAAAQTYSADGPAPMPDVPLVVLVDGLTAWSAEIVAGALKDHDRAVVVGSRTAGKGSVQSIVTLKEDGGAIKLTTAYLQLPRGEDIDKREGKADWGVDPTDGYYVPMDAKALDALIRRRLERERAGGPGPAAIEPRKVTPESMAQDEADPQVAAALRTLIARTTRGAFVKSGLPLAEQTARIKQIEQVRQRRQSLLDALKKVDQELGELGPGAGARP